jgi:hypothetical protein
MTWNDDDYSVREELDDYDRALQLENGSDVPMLPPWRPRQLGEPLPAFGARVLVYLMRYECTALLSDDELEQGEHAAVYAVCSTDMVPIARQKLSDVRHLIGSVLRGRKRCADLLAAEKAAGPAYKPNEGPMARLQPKPTVRPPAGQLAKPEIGF